MRTKVIVTVVFGAFGALLMWLIAATGIGAATAQWPNWVNFVISALCGGYTGCVLTQGKPSSVRVATILLWAAGIVVLSVLTQPLGLREWLAYSPSWHAAVFGGIVFAGGAVFALWRKR